MLSNSSFLHLVMLLALASCAVGAMTSPLAAEYRYADEDNSRVAQILHDQRFYDYDDPMEGAARMRQAAAEMGANIHLRPVYVDENLYPGQGTSTVELVLPGKIVWQSPADRSFYEFLTSAAAIDPAAEHIAIAILNRSLTIDETATLMASGIRIYERIRAGFIVHASRDLVRGLAEQEYVAWMGEYRNEYKYLTDRKVSPLAMYTIRLFGNPRDFHREELTRLGATVRLVRGNAISISSSAETMSKIEILPWVAAIAPAAESAP